MLGVIDISAQFAPHMVALGGGTLGEGIREGEGKKIPPKDMDSIARGSNITHPSSMVALSLAGKTDSDHSANNETRAPAPPMI